MVKTIVSRQHIAERHGQKKVGHPFIAKELKADEQGGDGAVCHAAENGSHADGCAQGGGKPEEASEQAAEGPADTEGGDNLAALKAGA